MKSSINIRLEGEDQWNDRHDILTVPLPIFTRRAIRKYAVKVCNVVHLQKGVVTACGEIMQQIIQGFPLDWPKLLCEWWT
jgi:hypothetical protein